MQTSAFPKFSLCASFTYGKKKVVNLNIHGAIFMYICIMNNYQMTPILPNFLFCNIFI